MIDAFFIVPLYLLCVLTTYGAIELAQRTAMLALPTQRSSHTEAIPVGGGIAIVLAYGLGLILLAWQQRLATLELLALCASLPVAVAGFIDDRRDLHHRLRLAIQASGVFVALLCLGSVPALSMGPVLLGSTLLTFILTPLCMIWLTNLYNFMDGIDGLAGTQTAFVSLVAGFMLARAGDTSLALLCLFLFAGSVGFTVWNWSPARIFMGDVGSGFAGMSLGLIALLSHYHGSMSLWSWFILLAVFVVDATVTLSRRVLRGQPWAYAHRQHAYQHMAKNGNSHKTVVLAVLLINSLFLLPLAIFAGKHPEYGVYFTILGVIPLLVLAIYCNAGKESRGA